jgi:hypothetical protein
MKGSVPSPLQFAEKTDCFEGGVDPAKASPGEQEHQDRAMEKKIKILVFFINQ